MDDVGTLISVTAILIGLFLILKYSGGFKTSFGALGGLYTQSVGALMGPNNITKGMG